MAPHSSTLAWRAPWTEKPGRPQSMGSPRVRHNSATSLSLFTFMHWRRKWQPTPVFLPGESQGWGSLLGAVCGVAQNQTRLEQQHQQQHVDEWPRVSRWLRFTKSPSRSQFPSLISLKSSSIVFICMTDGGSPEPSL